MFCALPWIFRVWLIVIVWDALFGGEFLPISGQISLVGGVVFGGIATDIMRLKLQQVVTNLRDV